MSGKKGAMTITREGNSIRRSSTRPTREGGKGAERERERDIDSTTENNVGRGGPQQGPPGHEQAAQADEGEAQRQQLAGAARTSGEHGERIGRSAMRSSSDMRA